MQIMNPDDYVDRIATIVSTNDPGPKPNSEQTCCCLLENGCDSGCEDYSEEHFSTWLTCPSSAAANKSQQQDSPTAEDNDSFYDYRPSNSVTVACNWRLRDPYERVTVICRPSKLPNGAGDGLFALKDIPPKTLISYYNGIRVLPGESYSATSWNYQIYVDWENTDDSPFIDIPKECIDSFSYSASLAHKANHGFKPNCRFLAADHPRYVSHASPIVC